MTVPYTRACGICSPRRFTHEFCAYSEGNHLQLNTLVLVFLADGFLNSGDRSHVQGINHPPMRWMNGMIQLNELRNDTLEQYQTEVRYIELREYLQVVPFAVVRQER